MDHIFIEDFILKYLSAASSSNCFIFLIFSQPDIIDIIAQPPTQFLGCYDRPGSQSNTQTNIIFLSSGHFPVLMLEPVISPVRAGAGAVAGCVPVWQCDRVSPAWPAGCAGGAAQIR